MATLTFSMETVTPLFMAGADPRGQAELRPTSFRGALRYWLRAALGGAIGDGHGALARLHREEAEVFGSTDRASPIVLRIPGEPPRTELYRPSRSGMDYLYWSMAGEKGKGTPPHSLVPVGGRFDLELSLRPVPKVDAAAAELTLRRAVAALWLLLQLGGVGARSHRTAGGLSVAQPERVGDLLFSLKGSDPSQLAQELGNGLRTVRSIFAELGAEAPSKPARFDILHPESCRVWVLGSWPSWEKAADELGAALREARRRTPADQRLAFGLPMKGVDMGVSRRASPLWLKLSRRRDGGCFAVATLFYSTLLPVTEGQVPATRGLSPVESFIQQFKPVEVRYA